MYCFFGLCGRKLPFLHSGFEDGSRPKHGLHGTRSQSPDVVPVWNYYKGLENQQKGMAFGVYSIMALSVDHSQIQHPTHKILWLTGLKLGIDPG